MRLTHLALACIATLGSLSAGVRAETAEQMFERLANDPSNTDALAYVEGSILGPDRVDGVPFSDTDEVFGTGSVSLRRAVGSGFSETIGEISFGRIDISSHAMGGEVTASTDTRGAFRDVWTIGGRTGTGTLVVRGVIDGTTAGNFGVIQTNATLATIGSSGLDAAAGVSLVGLNGNFGLAFDCREEFNSSCEGSVAPGTAQALWSLTVSFQYGDSLSFAQRMVTGTGSNSAEPPSQVGVHTEVNGIVLPAGATLTAASNQVVFEDGVWVYSDSPVPPPIPEPATWGLMLAGLAALLRLGSRGSGS